MDVPVVQLGTACSFKFNRFSLSLSISSTFCFKLLLLFLFWSVSLSFPSLNLLPFSSAYLERYCPIFCIKCNVRSSIIPVRHINTHVPWEWMFNVLLTPLLHCTRLRDGTTLTFKQKGLISFWKEAFSSCCPTDLQSGADMTYILFHLISNMIENGNALAVNWQCKMRLSQMIIQSWLFESDCERRRKGQQNEKSNRYVPHSSPLSQTSR